MTSTIEVSSTTSRSHSSGLSPPRLKSPVFGSTSSSRWMVFASKPVASVMRLAARPVGAQSSRLDALGREDAQDRVDDRGLADPRPAGDDQDLGYQGQPDRRDLAFGQRQTGLLLDPRQRLLGIDIGPGQRPAGQAQKPFGDDLLGPVQPAEEDAALSRRLCPRSPCPRPVRDPARFAPAPAAPPAGRRRAAPARHVGRPQWPSSIASVSA